MQVAGSRAVQTTLRKYSLECERDTEGGHNHQHQMSPMVNSLDIVFYCWPSCQCYTFLTNVLSTRGCQRNRFLVTKVSLWREILSHYDILGLSTLLTGCHTEWRLEEIFIENPPQIGLQI